MIKNCLFQDDATDLEKAEGIHAMDSSSEKPEDFVMFIAHSNKYVAVPSFCRSQVVTRRT